MILDKWISYDKKVWIAVVCAGLWIYFRTSDCYNMIPRQHIFPVVFVCGWTYLNYSGNSRVLKLGSWEIIAINDAGVNRENTSRCFYPLASRFFFFMHTEQN